MFDTTPIFRAYARRRTRQLRAQDPAPTQLRTLRSLVRKAERTAFGRAHGFASIQTVDDFRQRVPLGRYEDFWANYWKPAFPAVTDATWPGRIPFFAVTSGTTTGVTKYIPVSREMIVSNRKAGTDLFVHHVANRPHSRLLGGLSFMLGGSTALEELAPGVWSGDLSGIAAKTLPWWARLRYFPPRGLETISDWEEKITVFAERSAGLDLRSIGGVPSWMLIYFDRLSAMGPNSGRSLAEIFPHLEMIVHGGVNFAPYRNLFSERLAGTNAETREVYPASEGFIALADRGDGDGLRLMLDSGLFYEFVPVEELGSPNPTRHWVAEVETGVNYAIALSTCAGVWGYVVGDTVRFVDRHPPRILVTGRTSYSLSAFGEHLIGEEVEGAVAAAASEIDARVTDFSVGPVFPSGEGGLGWHLYIVEFGAELTEAKVAERFAAAVDAYLSETNDDYRSHRSGGYGMRAPSVRLVPPGTFAAWMKSRGQLGGQHKVPRIINDPELFENLRAFADKS